MNTPSIIYLTLVALWPRVPFITEPIEILFLLQGTSYITPSLLIIILTILCLSLFQLIFVIIIAGTLSVWERKFFAAIQRRQGPVVSGMSGLLQFFADGIKLFFKELVSPIPSNQITFFLAPIILFVTSLSGWAFIPQDFGYAFIDLELNLVWSFTFTSCSVYGIILAGWASNSKYAFLGSLRAAAQMISYEISLGFIFICILLMSGSLNLTKIVLSQNTFWFLGSLFPLAIIFFIVILAETNRPPFDLPEGESELVSGYHTEFSGIPFALFFLGEYSGMTLMSTIFVIFFLGGWLIFPNYFLNLSSYVFIYFGVYFAFIEKMFFLQNIFGLIVHALKTFFLMSLFILVRAAFPRLRYDHLMNVGWKVLLPLTFGFLLFVITLLKYFKGFVTVML